MKNVNITSEENPRELPRIFYEDLKKVGDDSIHIRIPSEVKDALIEIAAIKNFRSVSEYIRFLIEKELISLGCVEID
ncbi:MAG: hypothetical protein DRP24_04535 [Thermotoga sp.]|nr:MAG: hypothetical protein DRP24_04535 [Thermotoga sp.]RLF93080.1 MAG: hypothetical protein DRN52_06995 [Thermococci archaeon]